MSAGTRRRKSAPLQIRQGFGTRESKIKIIQKRQLGDWRSQDSPCGWERGGRWFVLIAEGQAQFASYLGPKFPQFIESDICGDVDSDVFSSRADAPPVSRMIEIRKRSPANFSQPFRKIKHGPAVVVVGDDGVHHRMQKAPAFGTLAHAVISRVLGKNRGIRELLEESTLDFIHVTDTQPFAISGSALSERWVIIFRLRNARIEAGAQERFGVNGVAKK